MEFPCCLMCLDQQSAANILNPSWFSLRNTNDRVWASWCSAWCPSVRNYQQFELLDCLQETLLAASIQENMWPTGIFCTSACHCWILLHHKISIRVMQTCSAASAGTPECLLCPWCKWMRNSMKGCWITLGSQQRTMWIKQMLCSCIDAGLKLAESSEIVAMENPPTTRHRSNVLWGNQSLGAMWQEIYLHKGFLIPVQLIVWLPSQICSNRRGVSRVCAP